MLKKGVVMGIVIIVMVTGTVGTGTVIVMGKGTVIVIVTEIAMAIVETVKEVIGTERDAQKEMWQIGLIKTALQFLIPQNVRKVDGTIKGKCTESSQLFSDQNI